jgi:hypothetical protein
VIRAEPDIQRIGVFLHVPLAGCRGHAQGNVKVLEVERERRFLVGGTLEAPPRDSDRRVQREAGQVGAGDGIQGDAQVIGGRERCVQCARYREG